VTGSAPVQDGGARRRAGLAVPLVLSAFAVLALVAHFALDERLARAAADAGLARSSVLQWATELGEGVWWLAGGGAAFVVFAALRRHNAAHWAFALVVSGAASGLATNLVKLCLGRARPKLLLESGVTGFHPFAGGYDFASMPSGHATTAGAAAATFALMFPQWRWPILAAGLALAATRVAIHAHYLSDILLGFAIGVAFAHATLAVWRWRWPGSVPRALGG
jgi:membrane-associated phospholipid phosphatase